MTESNFDESRDGFKTGVGVWLNRPGSRWKCALVVHSEQLMRYITDEATGHKGSSAGLVGLW
jgi:hypothetical protein